MYHLTESDQIKQIDCRLKNVKHSLSGILQIYQTVSSKKRDLEAQIQALEDEKIKVSQGQLNFDCDF